MRARTPHGGVHAHRLVVAGSEHVGGRAHIALTTVNSQRSLTDWLFSGVLVRFPRLRVAYAEGQIGWMPCP